MATFNDANLEKAYKSIYSGLNGSGGYAPVTLTNTYDDVYAKLKNSGAYNPVTMPEQTLEGITDQLAGILRPQYEQAIKQRYGATKQQKAAIDVDAASRGMGTSTWVTDAKNRLMNAEASDIAGMESDYASQLAGDALQQYNNYLGDKLALDQYNSQLARALGEDAYNRALTNDQLNLQISQYNNELARALGDDAYNRAMQQYQAGILKPQVEYRYIGGGKDNQNPADEVPDVGSTGGDGIETGNAPNVDTVTSGLGKLFGFFSDKTSATKKTTTQGGGRKDVTLANLR